MACWLRRKAPRVARLRGQHTPLKPPPSPEGSPRVYACNGEASSNAKLAYSRQHCLAGSRRGNGTTNAAHTSQQHPCSHGIVPVSAAAAAAAAAATTQHTHPVSKIQLYAVCEGMLRGDSPVARRLWLCSKKCMQTKHHAKGEMQIAKSKGPPLGGPWTPSDAPLPRHVCTVTVTKACCPPSNAFNRPRCQEVAGELSQGCHTE